MKARLAVLALTLLSACGGATDPKALTDEGMAALRSKNYPQAVERFDQALAALGSDTSKPEWMRAKMGAIEARTQTDSARAKSEFLELAAAHPDRVTDKEFAMIGGRLGEAHKLSEAMDLVEAGKKAHPQSESLQILVKQLGDMAKTSGTPEEMDRLKGLGYVGD